MAAIGRANTRPEVTLRRALWAVGLRGWRSDTSRLPGRPDVTFARARLALFVDGAFWHGHPSKYRRGIAGDYWDAKIRGNRLRDRRADRSLRRLGWGVMRVWDFEVTENAVSIARRVRALYDARRRQVERERMRERVR